MRPGIPSRQNNNRQYNVNFTQFVVNVDFIRGKNSKECGFETSNFDAKDLRGREF